MGEHTETVFKDEINLYDFYLIFKKKFILILITVVISVGVTVVISYLTKPVYRSTFIVKVYSVQDNSPLISPSEADKIFIALDNLRKEKQLDELSKKLSINNETAKNIAKLSAATIRDSKDLLEITIDTYSNSKEYVNVLINSIMQYLSQNQYVNDKIASLKESNLHLKGEIEARIQEIEAYKNIIFTHIKEHRAQYLGFNPLMLDEEIINLKQKLVELDIVLKFLKGFEITVGPTTSQQPVKPKIALNVLISAIISFLFGVFLALFIEWFEKHKKLNLSVK